MNTRSLHGIAPSLLAALLLTTACADQTVVAPDRVTRTNTTRIEDPPNCGDVHAPENTRLAFTYYAEGVQIYRWNGTSWVFVAPEATLYADAGGHGVVGTHYAGPTWEHNSGSKVVGSVLARCTPDVTAIPWLVLVATPLDGPGTFDHVTFIERANTTGGIAPSAAGSVVGEEARVPYTAVYLFYRDH